MRYYPLNRVKTNQRTAGGQFTLNGVEYRGDYYETFDGNFFTGKDPIQGPSQKLQPYTPPPPVEERQPRRREVPLTPQETVDLISSKGTLAEIQTFQTPQPFYPQPTENDYKRKSITRYFAKKRDRAGYIIEVNKETHDSLKNVDSVYDYITYETTSTLWQIAGPLYDDRTNRQYKIAGIIDTNKRLIEAKEPSFPGLIAYIGGDYAKFARLSN